MADASGDQRSPSELAAEIALQRERLAGTVDQLAHKLDVKAQARSKVADLRASATAPAGRPRPEVLAALGAIVAVTVVALAWRRRR